MIVLTKDPSELYLPKVSLMNIMCLKKAFGGSSLEEDMWVQKSDDGVSSVVARHGGRLYIYSDGSNTEEIAEFINVIGYSEIFTEKNTAEKLRLTVIKEFNVLYKESRKNAEPDPFSLGLKSVYDRLSMGFDSDIALIPFSDFAGDLSHRLRHGGAVAVTDEKGGAVAFLCNKGGIINGIAVDKAFRRQGIGSRLLFKVCSYIEGDVFVCASEQNTDFYLKNGFELTDTAVIAR